MSTSHEECHSNMNIDRSDYCVCHQIDIKWYILNVCIEDVQKRRNHLLLSVCMYSDSRGVKEDTQPRSPNWSTFFSIVMLPPTMSAFHSAATESMGPPLAYLTKKKITLMNTCTVNCSLKLRASRILYKDLLHGESCGAK